MATEDIQQKTMYNNLSKRLQHSEKFAKIYDLKRLAAIVKDSEATKMPMMALAANEQLLSNNFRSWKQSSRSTNTTPPSSIDVLTSTCPSQSHQSRRILHCSGGRKRCC
jgi:hypothetical protein